MARSLSKAEVELAKELQRRGLDVAPRRVARWREAKIIKADRVWPGGGGSESRYSAEMADRAEALARVLAQRRSLRDAVLILYGRGEHLEPEAVKTALVEYLEQTEGALARAMSKGRTPAAVRASLGTTKEGRAMLGYLGDNDLDEATFVRMVEGLAGQRKGWVGDFISASGFGVIAAGFLDDETRDALEEGLSEFTMPSIKREVIAANPEHIARALEDARAILPFVSSFTQLLARTANEPDALLLNPKTDLDAELDIVRWSAFALWARSHGIDLDKGAELAQQFTRGMAAILELVGSFSWARGPLFGPNSENELAKLQDYERLSIVGRIQDWLQSEPEAAEALSSLTSS
jgi:hypothetical protein